VKPNSRDARVVEEACRDLSLRGLCLIAASHDGGDWQAPRLHSQIDRDVRALRDDRDAPFHSDAAVLIGPEGCSIQRVDQAVAIGAKNWHLARRAQQPCVQFCAIFDLRKARREANRAARIHRGKLSNSVYCGAAVDPDESRVWCNRQRAHRSRARQTAAFAAFGMNRPDITPKTGSLKLLCDCIAPSAAADDRDGLRR